MYNIYHIIMIRTTFLGSDIQIQLFLLSEPPKPELVFHTYYRRKKEGMYFQIVLACSASAIMMDILLFSSRKFDSSVITSANFVIIIMTIIIIIIIMIIIVIIITFSSIEILRLTSCSLFLLISEDGFLSRLSINHLIFINEIR